MPEITGCHAEKTRVKRPEKAVIRHRYAKASGIGIPICSEGRYKTLIQIKKHLQKQIDNVLSYEGHDDFSQIQQTFSMQTHTSLQIAKNL